MKTLLMVLGGLLVLCALAQPASAQMVYQATWYQLVDTAWAHQSWDSVYIGPWSWPKYVRIQNVGSHEMKVAFENDTLKANVMILRPGTELYYDHGISYRNWIRTRCVPDTVAADSNQRYIMSTFGGPR